MRVLFVGDAISGKVILEEIKKVGELVALAVPDRDQKKLLNNEFLTIKTSKINETSIIDKLKSLNIDLLINFNSSIILSKDLLSCLTIGGINFHPGLLPRYAGSNVHQWAMLDDERWSGVTIHVIEDKIDAGPILHISKTEILMADTGLTLYIKLIRVGSQLIAQLLPKIAKQGFVFSKPQKFSNRKFFLKSKKVERQINFNQNVLNVHRFIQALNYRPAISPLGHSFIDAPLSAIEPVRIEVAENTLPPNAVPGEILQIDKKCVSIACKDGSIDIKKFWFENKLVGAIDGATASGMRVGQIM